MSDMIRFCCRFFAVIVLVMCFNAAASAQSSSCIWERPGWKFMLRGDTTTGYEMHEGVYCPQENDICEFRNEDFGIIAVRTEEGALNLSLSSEGYCPTCVCCNCVQTFNASFPIALPSIDISAVLALSVIEMVPKNMDTVSIRLALLCSPLEIVVISLTVYPVNYTEDPWYRIDKVVRHTVVPSVEEQSVIGMVSEEPSEILLYGRRGLVRKVTLGEQVAETNHDVDSADDIVCGGGGHVGSEDGTIYRVEDGAVLAQTGIMLRTVSDAGAGGDDGLFAERIGTQWKVYDAGDMSIRHLVFIKTSRGREAIVVDRDYGLHQVFVGDSVTKLVVKSPPELFSAFNDQPFMYEQLDTLHAVFEISDYEGNYEQPLLMLYSLPGNEPVKISDLSEGKYLGCVCGTKVLGQDSFSIDITPEGVRFNGPCLSTACPVLCGSEFACSYMPEICTTTVPWNIFDTVMVSVAGNHVRIVSGVSIGTERHRVTADKKGALMAAEVDRICASIRNNSYSIHFSEGFSLDIYDSRGRRIDWGALNRRHFLPPGIYIVRLASGNAVQSRVISKVRSGW